MGDDPSAYFSPPEALSAPLISTEKVTLLEPSVKGDEDVITTTNSTNQMLDVANNNSNNSNKRQRKGNRRQNSNSNSQQRNRNRNNNNNNNSQNDGASFDDNNPINVISAFNRTGKIYNKLRKNDAVKVIDTPAGRAGFVYQSSSNSAASSSSSNSNSQDSPMSTATKESSNWEDPYSQNQFVNRNANDVKLIPSDDTSNKKILPVLTADGKIALVVRGDTSRYFDESQNNGSGNSINTKKYEPITNLTSIITALNSNNDNNNLNKHNDSINVSDGNTELKSIQEQNRLINRLDEFFASVTNKVKHIEEELEEKLGIDLDDDGSDDQVRVEETEEDSFHVDPVTSTTTTTEGPFGVDEDKKDLLLINRPLSEVLGLPKKTHYHHPHDPMHTTPTEAPFRPFNENRRTHSTIHRTSSTHRNEVSTTLTTTVTTTTEEFDVESPEKINIAVIPSFDSELEERLFGKNRDTTNRNLNEINEIPNSSGAISSIHSAMHLMIAIACACTIFGVLGAYYRNDIANQIRIIHW